MSKIYPISSENYGLLSCLPYGVGYNDEGVCLQLQMGPHRILLDCGLRDLQPLQVESNLPPDLVFCSHAHSDHARGLLALHQTFPELPIYTSEVTSKLLHLNWQGKTSEEILSWCNSLAWRSPLLISESLSMELFPAGHLPGAASVLFRYKTPKRTYKVFYTGDFSVSNFQLVEGLSIEALRGLAPDVLIIESSYGILRHPHRRQQEKQLMERIERAIAEGKNVILPVPILGIGQEILKLLRSHHQFTGRELDIWVEDSVANPCDVYLEILSQLPASVQNFAKHQPLFWDDRVCPRMHRIPPKAKSPFSESPHVVIVDRKSDLKKYLTLDNTSWLILVSEHPSINTGLALAKIAAIARSTNISVESYLLAEHSDGRNTTQLIHNLRPQHVIFVHGTHTYLNDLASLEELQNRYQLHTPAPGTLVELHIGEKFIQPATPLPERYEGEINEVGTSIDITLPDAIDKDPRWNNFADTGLVEARWQGDELVLRGLSQKELLNQTNEARMPTDVDCCSTCRYYRSQRCWNQTSPLYGFKVTPEGYCPVFEPLDHPNL
jgi:Cft2 family RNA processing exonuclease